MEKTIQIKCKASLSIPLNELKPIQGELKALSNEDFVDLRAKILSQGIRFAFHVWRDKSVLCWYIIDGHGRDKVLCHLVSNENYQTPSIPCVEVEADSIDEAKKLVLDSSSTYHRVTQEGLMAYMLELKMQPVDLKQYKLDVRLPMITIGSPPPEKKTVSFEAKVKEPSSEFAHECPKCGMKFD